MARLKLDKKHIFIIKLVNKGCKLKSIAKQLGYRNVKNAFKRIRTLEKHGYLKSEGRKRAHRMFATEKGKALLHGYELHKVPSIFMRKGGVELGAVLMEGIIKSGYYIINPLINSNDPNLNSEQYVLLMNARLEYLCSGIYTYLYQNKWFENPKRGQIKFTITDIGW